MGASITLGPDSEAELEAILADGEDLSDSPGTPVLSALLVLPPLELVVSEPVATDSPTVTRHHVSLSV